MSHTEEKYDENKFKKNAEKIIIKNDKKKGFILYSLILYQYS